MLIGGGGYSPLQLRGHPRAPLRGAWWAVRNVPVPSLVLPMGISLLTYPIE
jgi:hypothetical protein